VSETRRLRQLEEENVVDPRAKREAVRVVREQAGLSERRACGLMGMHRGSWRYQRKEAALRARLRELAAERPRFGYRRLYIFLRREKARTERCSGWSITSGSIDSTGRKGWRCSVRGASDFGRKRECRWHCQRVRMKCGRWTTRMTKWPAGDNFGR
jgi:hypothetical protein